MFLEGTEIIGAIDAKSCLSFKGRLCGTSAILEHLGTCVLSNTATFTPYHFLCLMASNFELFNLIAVN